MFVYTRHALDKLKTKESRRLLITKKKIEQVVHTGTVVITRTETITVVGLLNKLHSLCVVYKKEGKAIKIITFFPAERGIYESKILH